MPRRRDPSSGGLAGGKKTQTPPAPERTAEWPDGARTRSVSDRPGISQTARKPRSSAGQRRPVAFPERTRGSRWIGNARSAARRIVNAREAGAFRTIHRLPEHVEPALHFRYGPYSTPELTVAQQVEKLRNRSSARPASSDGHRPGQAVARAQPGGDLRRVPDRARRVFLWLVRPAQRPLVDGRARARSSASPPSAAWSTSSRGASSRGRTCSAPSTRAAAGGRRLAPARLVLARQVPAAGVHLPRVRDRLGASRSILYGQTAVTSRIPRHRLATGCDEEPGLGARVLTAHLDRAS